MDIAQTNFSRVAIIGCPGSGKTTFSNKLQEIMGREVVHLDKVLWKPDWQMLEYPERVKIHNQIICQDQWIIDGMWKSHLEDRFFRATLVIFLDYKRRVSLGRAIKRRIKFAGQQRDDIADGCLEKLDNYFLKYIWTFRKNVRPIILQLIKQNPDVQVVVCKNPKETSQYLAQLTEYFKNA